ncbi:hypothetical protein, partial [Agarivorans albus]|uniref:hypothetical protein n=1 Tax=Agarivorans albus TaxID=182262 RepID=UPI00058E268A
MDKFFVRCKRKLLLSFLLTAAASVQVQANNLNLASQPLYVSNNIAPMVMLVMGRDHTLYYEAYNDASDIDGDGTLDTTYKPNKINYEGYFNSNRCYSYNDSKIFVPEQLVNNPGIADGDADTLAHKTCSGVGEWSGDFLNYLTMSRMDILRKVLYGGYRQTDSASFEADGETINSETILERVFIPQDAHSWGKMYSSVDDNGFDITNYTPLSLPSSGAKHFFGTASFEDKGVPLLKVRLNVTPSNNWPKEETGNIWEWASTERPVLSSSGRTINNTYQVRVKVCVETLLEENCKKYSDGNYKPTA